MSKKIIISLDGSNEQVCYTATDSDLHGCPMLFENEYPNIYLDHEITKEEYQHSFDVIVTYFMQNNIYRVEIDLNERNMEEKRNKSTKNSPIRYLCNGKECSQGCNNPDCKLTTKIEFAKNFKKDVDGGYTEKEEKRDV